MRHKIYRVLKRLFIIISSMALLLSLITFFYMRQEKFGKLATGARLEKIKNSPNFRDGKFQNVHHTPQLTEGYGYGRLLYEFFFKRNKRRKPIDSIPTIKTDLLHLPVDQDIMIWFGHSSYFIQLDGKKILVDPVFSGDASPIPGTNKAFEGTDRYSVSDLPELDYILITHDHYDHTDHSTLVKLQSKTRKILCGLGVGAHLEFWGFTPDQIIERDWHEEITLDDGFVVHTTPARHFSGRGFSPNRSLWLSYVFQSPTMKIYIGGDSGYDTHFKEIGNKFGPLDLAILENGQYDIKWRYIHMLPDEVVRAAEDLQAERLFPVHSSKFVMANHAWDDPLVKVSAFSEGSDVSLVTPIIGEPVYLKDSTQQFKQWWVGLK
jgi:L-ascorbate metabolism protein UlaG (beta-lactamase superfamily)